MHTWQGDQTDYMLRAVKFMAYYHVYEFDAVLQKSANLSKREKDVLDPSVMDLSNVIDKAIIKTILKNDSQGICYYGI